jgi:hypothetical protein
VKSCAAAAPAASSENAAAAAVVRVIVLPLEDPCLRGFLRGPPAKIKRHRVPAVHSGIRPSRWRASRDDAAKPRAGLRGRASVVAAAVEPGEGRLGPRPQGAPSGAGGAIDDLV